MAGVRKVLKRTCLLAALLGCVWFCLPVLRGSFELGSVFGIAVCLLGAFLLWRWPRLTGAPGPRRTAARVLLAAYGAGLLWAGYLTALMANAGGKTPPPETPALVLGCQIRSDYAPSLTLRQRLDTAAEYLRENPDARCVVTGGQGDDEPCAEALVMERELVSRGVAQTRILREDRAKNTRENMRFSAALLEKEGLGQRAALVTDDYHMARALRLAREAGLEPYAVPVRSDPLLFPQYYGRELLSLTKWHIERLLACFA